jgi:DNA-nicking Smr family endonuclease
VSDDDQEIFRRAMRDARPLASEPRVPKRRPRPKPQAGLRRADDEAGLGESLRFDADHLTELSGEALSFKRPFVSRRTLRRLARGSYAVQGEIDLHGMTVAEAKSYLAEFLTLAVARSWRCVRVVHGKGLGSGPRGAVLKPNVDRWLRHRDSVLAFVSTRQVHGGTGAVYVLLRAR